MTGTTVHLLSLGCARNDVDAEELAARLADGDFVLVEEPDRAEVVVVNTCGFIDQAKQDSIEQLLAAVDLRQAGRARLVVATGCLAERYGVELAEALPEIDAVLGFDSYDRIAASLRDLLAGRAVPAHRPRDRRRRLPLAPVDRPAAASQDDPWLALGRDAPGRPAAGPPVPRRRLADSPSAPLKIASGCDRRCTFCAIPAFRGAFRSRPVEAIVAEAGWLAGQGVKELCLVSENTTSYGKDFGDLGALPRLLDRLSAVEGIEWIRLSYLQPAEIRPELIAAMAQTPKVVPYFDLSFQHVSARLLRRMRRFGDADSFLELIARIRGRRSDAGLRSNVIVGFPGETEADVTLLTDFLAAAELDAVGVFGYSDEAGTEAASLDGHLDEAEIAARVDAVAGLADVTMAERARRWIGGLADVLLERPSDDGWIGRTPQQGPDTDGETLVQETERSHRAEGLAGGGRLLQQGGLVRVLISDSVGVDLVGSVERLAGPDEATSPGSQEGSR